MNKSRPNGQKRWKNVQDGDDDDHNEKKEHLKFIKRHIHSIGWWSFAVDSEKVKIGEK